MIGLFFGFFFVCVFFLIPEASAAVSSATGPASRERFPLVFLEQQVDRQHVYPQQPVELSAHLYIKDAPGNIAHLDPFSRIAVYQRERTPLLYIPWADDKSVPEDLHPMEPWNMWIQSIPTNRVGFSLNRFSKNFGASGVDTFLPTVERIERKDEQSEQGEIALYWKYTIRRRFITKKSGTVTIPAVRFSGPVLAPIVKKTAVDSSKKTQKEDAPEKINVGVQNVDVLGPGISLTVLEVPLEKRPQDDVGIFGVFHWSIDIQPRQAKVGEPLTLIMMFSGDGSIVNAKAPDLTLNSTIAGNFKVYPAKEELENDTIRYVYLLRPKKQGKLAFPSISVSYFNTDLEQYQTLKSSPLTLEILSAEVGSDFLLRSGPGRSSQSEDIFLTESGIFANFENPDAVKNQKIRPRIYFLFIVSLAGVYVLIALYVFALRFQMPEDRKKKREMIIQQAKKRFEDVSDLLAEHKFSESCTQVQNIFIQFIASIHGQTPQGMTPRDALQLVRNWSLNEMQIDEFADLFDQLDSVRFGTMIPQKVTSAVKKGEVLLDDLISALPERVSR